VQIAVLLFSILLIHYPLVTVNVPAPTSAASHERQDSYAFSAPLKSIKSILVHPPTLNQWYGTLIINFQSGESSPPLWFHDDESQSTVLQRKTQGGLSEPGNTNTIWGGDEIIKWLAHLVIVER
jgi:hypothetical protein